MGNAVFLVELSAINLYSNLMVWKFVMMAKNDASVKSSLPPGFWSVGIVFWPFFGLLAVASKFRNLKNLI